MILNLADYVCFQIYMRGFYEAEVVRHLRSYLRPGMTFFDVGAHFGQYTLVAAGLVGGSGAVHAFEPGPQQHEYLKRNVRLNGLGQVCANFVALGESIGTVGFVVAPLRNLGGSHVAPADGGTLEVPMITLDMYCHDSGVAAVHAMKIDVEGAELQVLRGASETLARRPPSVIFYECIDRLCRRFGYRAVATHELLLSHGYRIHTVRGWKLEPVDALGSEDITDFVALHP